MARRRKKRRIKKVVKRRRKQRRDIIPDSIKPWISGALMFLIALFVFLSFFNLAGAAGRGFLQIMNFLFSNGSFVLVIMFLLGGVACFSKRVQSRLSIYFAMLLGVLGTVGIWGLVDLSRVPDFTFHFFYAGKGGIIGNLLSYPLFKIFGFWISLTIFCVLILISLFIFWYYLRPEKKEKEEKQEPKEEKPFIHKIFTPKFKLTKVEDRKEEKIKIEDKKPEPEEEKKPVIAVKKLIDTKWNLPPLELLEKDKGKPEAGDTTHNSEVIKRTLENFDIPVEMADINIGPTVTQYTLKPAEGVKLSKITTLNNNLALALAAHPLRIEAPIPGKSLVGIEVPNKTRTLVRLRELLGTPDFQDSESPLLFTVGRDVVGDGFFADLGRMPHLLLAGSTGSGKTIGLSSVMLSLLYRNSPQYLRLILVDPKRVEFVNYNGLSHLLCPVIYDVDKTLTSLKWLGEEMERRFEFLSKLGARNVWEYNQTLEKNKDQSDDDKVMPYIVFIVDELADLMAAKGRDIEAGIVKLAQKARAVGIHLILATQRPSVEVITGLIKANITSRIAFQVASQVDSRTILDSSGAEKLLGRGDLLYISAEISKPKRLQGAYSSGQEIRKVVDFIIKQNHKKELEEDSLRESLTAEMERVETMGRSFVNGAEPVDPIYEEAKELVLETRKASASYLQRRLRIGYARAARLLDTLEDRGIVGPARGAKPREVLTQIEEVENDNEEEL